MVTVIITSHNYGKFIKDCVNSVLNNDQDLIDEIIIINDSSEDNTDDIIKKNFSKIKKIKYFKKNFLSLTKSLNFSINIAKSSWITKIDADDYVTSSFFTKFCNFANKKDFDFIYGNLLIKDEIKKKEYLKNQKVSKFFKFIKYPVGSGTLFSKKIWNDVGGFNESNYYQDDYDFWLKINKKSDIKIGYLDQAEYIYRKHQNNMSKNIFKKNFSKIKVFLSNFN